MNNQKSKIKTIVVAGLVATVMATSVSAMRPQHKGKNFNPEEIVTQLNLDESKSNSLITIMNQHKSDMEAQRSKIDDRSYEDFKARQAAREQHRSEIQQLLTTEEYAQFEKAMWQQRQNSRGQGKGKRRQIN